MFRFNKTIIRELAVCASLKLPYWCQLIYFVIELGRNTNKTQLVIEFIIPKFIESSTCFERHTAHYQEFQTVYAASGLYTHVVTGRCQG
jgi:hypothetical protein